jgi:cbb3-type cytochrome oxidase maturation protein
MSALFILIIISLIVAVGFLIAFIWAVKSGQLEDNSTPAMRILWDHQKKDQE